MNKLFKRLLFVVSFVFVGIFTIQAQAPTIHWQKCYGDVHENVAYMLFKHQMVDLSLLELLILLLRKEIQDL